MIRKATPKDIPEILELYRKGLEELGQKNIKESHILNKVVISYHLAPCFLLEIDDIIVGIAGLTVVTTSHNGVASLADYIFYVEPEYRSIKTLGVLVDSAKNFATENALPLRLEFISNNDEELRKRIFRLHGFKVSSVTGVYNEG